MIIMVVLVVDLCSFLLVSDEATVVSVNMFVRDFIEINDLKMVNIRDDKLNFQFSGVPISNYSSPNME